MYKILLIGLVALTCSFSNMVRAELVTVTGKGSVLYKSELKSDLKATAVERAKVTAFRKFVSRQPPARKSVLAQLESKFLNSIDTIIPEFEIQRDKNDKESKRYSVIISAKIDSAEIERLFDDLVNLEGKLSGDFGALFIARVEDERKTFDKKITKIRSDSTAASASDTSASDGTKTVEGAAEESFSKTQTGGSQVKKRDAVIYSPSLELSEGLQEVISELLVNSGFNPMEYSELEDVPYLDDLIDEEIIRPNGSLPTRVRKQYQQAAIEAGWNFFGYGTISVGLPREDPAKGNLKVSAQVAFKVFGLESGRAKTVATVRKKVVNAWGDDPASLETVAMNKAAELAMATVIGQLQKKALKKQ